MEPKKSLSREKIVERKKEKKERKATLERSE